VAGTAEKPRLCVFRSLNHIYAQLIDDQSARTLVSASSLDIREVEGKRKSELAAMVGSLVAKRALEATPPVKKIVFDRGGYTFHGRVKALAEAARAAGLEF
jgi:large subunit ribosomal protein L18